MAGLGAFASGSYGLPSGRAYELVSPQDKNGGDIMGDSSRTRAAHAGDAVQFASLSAFSSAQGTGLAVDYMARRSAIPGSQGWSTHPITPVQDALSQFEVFFSFDVRYMGEFSPELGEGIFLAKSLLTSAGENVGDVAKLYLRDDLLVPGAGSYSLVTDCLPPPAGPCTSPLVGGVPVVEPGFADSSDDFGHIIFESTYNLVDGATGDLPKLYEWDHGNLRLAGILPNDTPADSSAAGRGASTNTLIRSYTANTISSNGSRILFTSPVSIDSQGEEESDLFLREDHQDTFHVNAEEREVPPELPDDKPAQFWAASDDLSRIFFTSAEQLTDDDDDVNSVDLFMYDATLPPEHPNNLTRLSVDSEPDDTTFSNIGGVIGVSDDGRNVYFTSRANQLVDDGVPGDTVEPCGSAVPCVFLWSDGEIRLVGRINRSVSEEDGILGLNAWSTSRPQGARVTPDGRHLLFASEGTPNAQPAYDHGDGCFGTQGAFGFFDGSTPACSEVYLFDATANGGEGALTCVSCNPGGAHLTATDALFDFRVGASAAGRTSHLNQPLSDDGRFAFFATGESLVPEDTNGAVYDVYEYDAVNGDVALISSGKSPFDSFFLDASADGHDVFFRTREQLVGWDTDQQIDLYDARIGGGFPDPVTPQECEGTGCQGPQGTGPNLAIPATATFEDVGGGGKRGRAAVFHAFDLGPKKLKRWARTGIVTLLVRVSDAGRVSARVRARLGKGSRAVAKDSERTRGGGTVRLRLRLSRAALAKLRADGRLRVAIVVGYSRADSTQRARATLIAP